MPSIGAMIRALRAPSFVDAGWRLLTPFLVLALLFSVDAATAAPAEAGGSSVIADIRARQLEAERAMRRADRQIDELKRLRQHHKKLLKKAKREFEQAKRQRDRARRQATNCLLYTSPSPRDRQKSRMPSSA
jgi:ElaB/YqjD/DUF883 family membrane-anchored ribosome-binding protein